ncbi:MAG TPA: DUF742 domain-containing protein [Acidimicrobiia bacterium]|nr:DUF742 domain-containing protein [Acidimicrobiia bacterium]
MTEGSPLDERRARRSVVRPYVLTHGRTRAAGADVPLDAAVLALVEPLDLATTTTPEARTIVALCQEPIPLAEVAARLGVPLGVARVLVGDLTGPGIVTIQSSRPVDAHTDVQLLERLLDGIRSL